MLTMTKRNQSGRLRSDHRTPPKGSFEDYLLHAYPQGQDYVPGLGSLEFEQPYHTERAGGRFVHVEGGKPAMKEAFVNALSGYPHQVVRRAIEVVRSSDPDAIAALEWAQTRPTRRPTRYAFAAAHHIGETTVSSRLQRAVRKVHEEIHDERRAWNNPTDEERESWRAQQEVR